MMSRPGSSNLSIPWARIVPDVVFARHAGRFALYLAAVVLAGGLVTAGALDALRERDLPAVAILTLLIAASNRIHVASGRENRWDLSIVPEVAGLALLPSPILVTAIALGTLLGELWFRRPWIRAMFNVTQLALAYAVASYAVSAGGGPATSYQEYADRLPWFAVAAIAAWVANTCLVASAVALRQGGRPWTTWWALNRGALVAELALAAGGLLLALAWLIDARIVPLLLIPAGASWLALYRGRMLERTAYQAVAVATASERLAGLADDRAVVERGAALLCELCCDAVRLEAVGHRVTAFRPDTHPDGVAVLEEALAAGPGRAALQTADLRLANAAGAALHLRVAWVAVSTGAVREALVEPLAQRILLALDQAQLLRQAAQVETLREVTRARSDLLAAVSHELHPPLAVVLAHAESLAHDTPGARVRATAIASTAQHLTGLVDDLLDAARLETGRYALRRRPIELQPLAESALQSARATHPGVDFVLQSPPEPITVEADPARLLQVLSNLLSNAARYGPSDGTVRLMLDTDSRSARVAVEDQGPGVPPADRERIFEKFHRGRTDAPGLGLGLSIARDLVLAHVGTIRVEDARTGGARFVVELPRVGA